MNESDPRSNAHYLSIAMRSSENKAWIFFRPYFHYFSSSVHHCEDHFQSRLNFSGHHTLSHQLMSESVLTELQATPWSNYKTQSVSFLVLYDDWSTLKIVSVIISYFLNTMSTPELIYSITDFLLGAVSS